MRAFRCALLLLTFSAAQSCAAVQSDACEGISRDEAVKMALEAREDLLFGTGANPRDATFRTAPITDVKLADGGYAAKVTFTDRNGRTITTLIHTDCYIGWTSRDPERPAA